LSIYIFVINMCLTWSLIWKLLFLISTWCKNCRTKMVSVIYSVNMVSPWGRKEWRRKKEEIVSSNLLTNISNKTNKLRFIHKYKYHDLSHGIVQGREINAAKSVFWNWTHVLLQLSNEIWIPHIRTLLQKKVFNIG